MKKFIRHIPITKIDVDQRMVYGFASTPDLDSDGEIISLKGLAKSLPEYMRFPTIREMHLPKAIGTTKEAEIKDDGLWIGAKIVADNAWKLVKEGVYKGFSVGGHIVKQVDNVIEDIDLIEISLVDVPANKAAVIQLWKKDMNKNAETVFSLSNIMIQIRDTISFYKAIGKKTTKLEKILEELKSVIIVEAQETEKESEKKFDEMFLSENPTDLEKIINSLGKLSFGDNEFAETLRKEVLTNMNKKAKEIKKGEVAEETT